VLLWSAGPFSAVTGGGSDGGAGIRSTTHLSSRTTWRFGSIVATGRTPADEDADELYAHRQDVNAARRAAALWEPGASAEYDAAWKLARVCYWLGSHGPEPERRGALERGVRAGSYAVRLGPDRAEG